MPVGPLFTVFGLLLSRATTVSTSDVLLFLGLGLHLVVLLAGTTATSEVDTVLQNLLEITLLTHDIVYYASPPVGRGRGWVNDGIILLL